MVRLPRDLSGRDLARALRRYGYAVTRQTGSQCTAQGSRPAPEREERLIHEIYQILDKYHIYGGHDVRAGRKKAQDLLYIDDTIELFATTLPALSLLWRDQISASLTRNERKTASDRARQIFTAVTDTIREAVRIPVDRRVEPEEFRQRCEAGLHSLITPPAAAPPARTRAPARA